MTIFRSGMTRESIISVLGRGRSPVDLTKHDVKGSDQRDDVCNKMTLDQRAQALEVAERRRPDAEPVRVGGLAVADDEVAELALRRFDRVIGLPRRRLDEARHLADDRALGQAP